MVDVGGGPGERRKGVREPHFFGDVFPDAFWTLMRRSRALIRESRFDRVASVSGDRGRDSLGIFFPARRFLTNLFDVVFGADFVNFFD